MHTQTMRAAVCLRYGGPEIIEIRDVPVPIATGRQVLVRVRAASVNSLDWGSLQGKPFVMRLINGLQRPRSERPGVDLAGEVVATGEGVTQLSPGCRVFGTCVDALDTPLMQCWVHTLGSWAEFVLACEDAVAPIPSGTCFTEAASLPLVAFTALQSLRDLGKIAPGSNALINGASGGVGTAAVQIAVALGGHVTAVCSSRNFKLVTELGAARVLDYACTDLSSLPERFDVVLDCVGNISTHTCKKLLRHSGVCVLIGELTGRGMTGVLGRMATAWSMSRIGGVRMVPFLARPRKDDLLFIAELLQAKKLRGVVDRTYSIEQIPEAIRTLDGKHVSGKLVILPS